jgi:hypothetical protein
MLDWSVIEECKQFDRAQQEKEKQQAIQQSTKRKKHPPMSPFFQPPPATAMPTHKVVQKRSADVVSIFKWKDMMADLLKQALPAVMATWSEEKRENIKMHCQKTAYIVALMEYLYCQLPCTYCDGTKLGGGEGESSGTKRLSLVA